MEVEKTAAQANGDAEEKPAVDRNKDAVGDLISESKTKSLADDTIDGADAKILPKENADDNPKGDDKGSLGDEKPSKRVREGQKWNDRSRRYNKNDRPIKRNNKSDLTSQEESSDPVAIRKQVEFYFSDSNLLQDKFLFTKVEGHENVPVPISVIHSFKRMRHFQPLSAVIDALKESKTLNIVDDDTCIQRKEPLPEGLVGKPMVEIQKVHEDASMARSIYAKGFGDEEPSTQFDIEAFFANFGSTNSVRLRRAYDQTFKGSVFVEFDTEDTQKSFLALDPKPKWQGKELQIKSKKQYCDDKVEDIKAGKVRPNEQDNRNGHHHRHPYKRRRDSPDYDRGAKDEDDEKDDRDWRVRREEDQKSGFKERHGGKRRGFGSSGRGRGGRDNRGPKDRNDEREKKDERHVGVPKVRAASSEPRDNGVADTSPTTGMPNKNENSPLPANDVAQPGEDVVESIPNVTDAGSKKRARDEDDVPEGEAATKKVDTKGEES